MRILNILGLILAVLATFACIFGYWTPLNQILGTWVFWLLTCHYMEALA